MSSLHQHAKDVFFEALARPAGEREAFVAQVCGTDRALRQEVESLLAFHSEDKSEDSPSTDAPLPITPGRDPGGMPFAPGEVFAGRYRMITRIGRGGMGDVWRADDLVLETPVALKLIHVERSEDARERILNEVRLARQITHPAVCRVFDVGEADGRVFFSMELVQGEDLAALLRRVGRLPSEKVVEIAPPALRRSGGRARAGRAAPRPEAGQRPHRRRRPRADHRLRHRRLARADAATHARPARPATWRPSS